MVKLTVEKPVAVCLLDAVKLVLGQLAGFRMEVAEQSFNAPQGLSEVYSAVRGLRERVQRLVAAYPTVVDLDFDTSDGDLIVSVAARAVEMMEADLRHAGPGVGDPAHGLAQERVRILLELAPAFASKPLVSLPGRPQGAGFQARRSLEEAVMQHLRSAACAGFDDPSPTTKDPFGGGPTMAPRGPDADSPGSSEFGVGDRAHLMMQQPGPVHRGGTPPGPSVPQSGDPGPMGDRSPSPARDPQRPAPSHQAPSHQAPVGRPGGRGLNRTTAGGRPMAPGQPMGSAGSQVPTSQPGASPQVEKLVDPKMIRDPRLRALVGMDQKALDRATRAGDFRMVAVVLRSLLAGVVWDAALQRRREIQLKGPPDTWAMPDVIGALLGESLSHADILQVANLDRCGELMHPPAQLARPQVINRETVDAFRALARGIAAQLLGAHAQR